MKSFLIACAVAIGIAVCAGIVLNVVQRPYTQAFKGTTDVRL
jgi:hypothetical protein